MLSANDKQKKSRNGIPSPPPLPKDAELKDIQYPGAHGTYSTALVQYLTLLTFILILTQTFTYSHIHLYLPM